MKQKLFMITDTGWWDTDRTVIPYLKSHFDIEVYLIAAKNNNKFTTESLEAFQKQYGITVNIWKRINRIRNPLNFVKYLKGYLQIRKKFHPRDSIFYYVYTYDPYINILVNYIKSYRKLITIHDYEEHTGLANNMRTKLKNMIINTNKYFHFFSQHELQKFRKVHPNKKAFFTQMPLKNFGEPAISEGTVITGKRILLFFGFIRYYKGLDLLLQALKIVNNGNYELIIAGAADNWDDYRELISGNKHIVINNTFIADHEIPVYFAKAHYLVLPYRDATQSGPALIGVHYNVPIIASDLDCFKEYLTDGSNGFLFKKNDVDGLALALTKALDISDEGYARLKNNMVKKADEIKYEEQNTGKLFSNFINQYLKK